MTNFEQLFKDMAKQKRRRIGITILRPIPETVESLRVASQYADLLVVGAEIKELIGEKWFENIIEIDEDAASLILVRLLRDKKVEGIVRGQVKDSYTLDVFFKEFGKEPIPSDKKVFTSIMQKGDYSFSVAGASVYQGMTIESKIYETERLIKYLKEDLKIEPKIAVMGVLRPSSKRGKYEMLDKVTKDCEDFYNYLVGKGYVAKQYYMEYETAVWERNNLIVPSMGVVGNSWMKSLLYLGDWKLLNCFYLDLGVVYEDGTRNEKDFSYHIIHAVAMCNKKS